MRSQLVPGPKGPDDDLYLPSPEALKNKILVKGKRNARAKSGRAKTEPRTGGELALVPPGPSFSVIR